jgi:hypothetical protein
MSSTDFSIIANGRTFLWPLGFDEVSLNQQVVVENYLRFALKYLEKRRSGGKYSTLGFEIGFHGILRNYF